MRILLLIIFGLLVTANGCASGGLRSQLVPHGRAPLLDHRIGENEWADAVSITIPGDGKLLLVQNTDYLFLGLRPPPPLIFGVDLFIADESGQLLDLHASSYLGERGPRNGQWPDWVWWNNSEWFATISPYTIKGGRPEFLVTDGKEFPLSKRRFSHGTYRLRLDCRLKRGAPGTVFPAGSTELDATSWFELSL